MSELYEGRLILWLILYIINKIIYDLTLFLFKQIYMFIIYKWL